MSASRKKTIGGRRAVAEDIHRAALRLLRHLRSVDRDLGLSAPRLSTLSVLVFVGPKTVGELAAIEQVSQPTMSSQIKELEKSGLVELAVDEEDRRSKRVIATKRGRKILDDGRGKRVEQLAAMMADLSSTDLKTLSESGNADGADVERQMTRLVNPKISCA